MCLVDHQVFRKDFLLFSSLILLLPKTPHVVDTISPTREREVDINYWGPAFRKRTEGTKVY
jgi:hypothetical protein